MIDRIKTIFLWLSSRVLVFHVFICIFIFVSVDQVRLGTKIVNFFMPSSMVHLSALEAGKSPPDPKLLKSYEKYFEVVNRYISPSPFGFGTLGFINYHQGDPGKALRYYSKALSLYSSYLNYYYNMALIHLNRDDFRGAVTTLAEGLQKSSMQRDSIMISMCRYETRFFTAGIDSEQLYVKKWNKDYRDAVFLFLAIMIEMGDQERALQISRQVMKAEGMQQDERLQCLQHYGVSSGDATSSEQQAVTRCQKIFGWQDVSTRHTAQDLFNLKRLLLKIW